MKKNILVSSKWRIVFLDAGSIDYGDVSLAPLLRTGSVRIFHQTPPGLVAARCRGARIVITNKCRFDQKILSQLPDLQCLCITATGTNNVDLKAARRQGVAVTNVAGYSTESVAQLTIAFLLALALDLKNLTSAVEKGKWSQSPFFALVPTKITELSGKTLGILGYGRIGRRVAFLAKTFGMTVLVGRIPGRKYSGTPPRISLNTLLKKSDFICLHAPLTPLTQDLIHEKQLRKMKKSAYLINMARGGLVNEKALAKALKRGYLAGAATDVLSEEPPKKNHILLGVPNLWVTPHIGWASREARENLIRELALNIKAFQQGKRRNRVV